MVCAIGSLVKTMTFDYQMQYANNGELTEAITEALVKLNRKVWFVGQSLGGVLAQIIAKHLQTTLIGAQRQYNLLNLCHS